LDEDIQSDALIRALRARGVSVVTTSEAGGARRTDEEQLRFATSRNLVFVTCNIVHFARLHADSMAAGREHAGIVLVQQQRWGPGELARRVIRLLAAAASQSMRNRLEFISNW
jgi:hypothetical protein